MRVSAWRRSRTLNQWRRSTALNGLATGALAAPLIFSILPQALAQAPAAASAPSVNVGRPVTGLTPLTPHPAAVRNQSSADYVPTAVHWPAAHSGSATLSAPGAATADTARPPTRTVPPAPGSAGATAFAAGTPVWAQALQPAAGTYQGPSGLAVGVASHDSAVKAGVNGVLLTAAPSGGGRGTVRVGVDYSAFAQAYGGNYGSRLRLVSLPACALTTPQLAACRAQSPLGSTNNPAAQSVSAQLTLDAAHSASPQSAGAGTQAAAAGTRVLALTGSSSGGDGGGNTGTYTATSLKPSGSWSAGGSTGAFTYSYPITVPPAVSALVPTVNLSYNSGSVDGQTAATQSQADWVGDGWSTPENYVEQTFVSCANSPEGTASPQATADSCYDGPILTLSLNGSSTSLVCASNCTSADAVWKPSSDNGEVVTHNVNTGNGTNTYNTDSWTVTDRTGTVFSFGLNQLPGWSSGQPTTSSVQYEPVFSAHQPNGGTLTDPCYKSTWSLSVCTMAYRWNLDYVKDTHGNAMAYYYKQDTNAYAQNNNTASAVSYVRDAHLDHIDYGFTDGGAYGTVPDKVAFTPGDRCDPSTGTCDPLSANTANWPDVPYDLNCAAGGPCQNPGPSMWSTVRLTGITTEQYNGAGYTPVDSYSLAQSMPAPGDGTAATLWLQSITHTGDDTSAGGSAPPPLTVTFTGVQEANRVDTATDGLAALDRYRIQTVTTETGSAITVNYELANPCTAPVTLSPATNTSSCYPVYWTPQGASSPLLDWFNKYVVRSVGQSDPSGGSAGLYTSYNYPSGAAWHYDDNEVVQAKYRTYGQYRGYGDVQTFTGHGSDPVTESESTYYRGMSNDNNTTPVTLTDSQGGAHDDTNQFAGDTLETTGYNYSGGPITGSTINSYWLSAPIASRPRSGLPALTANATGQVETWTRTALTDGGATTWRKTETDTAYDTTTTDATFGLPTITYAHGDLSLTGNAQQRCTVTTYAPPNTSLNLVGLAAEVETDANPCGGTSPGGSSAPGAGQTNALAAPVSVNRPADVISDKRTFYDLQPLGSTAQPSTSPVWPQPAPTYGDISETQKANGYTGGAFTYQANATTTYDSYGRVLGIWDALGGETSTAYTMTNGVTTAVKVINPLGQSTSTTYDPYRALAVTLTDVNGVGSVMHYDGLGNLIAVWGANRSTSAAANALYTYMLGTSTTPTVVTTQTLNDESQYATSTTLYDALLRVRQTQTPTPQGGRLLADTFYDTHGWVIKANANYWDKSTAPNATVMQVADDQVDRQTVTAYDGAGRAVQVQSKDNFVSPTVDHITSTQYTGDRTVTVPPQGGVAAATVSDALGRASELDQYTTAPTVTTTTTGGITTVAIAGGITQATDYLYNNVGQQTDVKDASTGAKWSTTYNLLGQAIAKSDPDAGATTGITYDAAGNLTQSTDARGKTISYTYDPLNRKTSQYDAPVSAQSPSNQAASWAYDNSNNAMAGMTDPIGHLTTETAYSGGNAYTTQSAGFNVFGESLGETVTIPSSEGKLAGSYAFGQTYSPTIGLPKITSYPAAGSLSSETVTAGYTTLYNLDLPMALNSLSGYLHAITYTAFGQVGKQVVGSTSINASLTNTFDPHTGALTDQQVSNAAAPAIPIDDTSYKYDAAGNPVSQSETRQGTSSETQCYQYDPLDRLTQAWTATDACAVVPTSSSHATVGDGIANGAYWTSWLYNSDGQRKAQTDHSLVSGTIDTTTSYAYGGSASSCTGTSSGVHTLASTSTTGPSGTAGDTYCYDALGNTTQRNTTATGQQSLTWNDLGQLTAVTTASAGSSYLYGPDGRLLLQKDPGTTTLYLPGEQVVLNTTTTAVTGTRFYALPGGGQAVRTGTGSSYYFELTDQHNTSTLTLSNTLTNPVWRQQTPYGAPRGAAPASWPDNHGFLNKPQDTTTGLTNVGARWYDPALGRFASLDPAFEPSSPQQQNGYTYAADNPVTGSDPTGLCTDNGTGPSCGGSGNGDTGGSYCTTASCACQTGDTYACGSSACTGQGCDGTTNNGCTQNCTTAVATTAAAAAALAAQLRAQISQLEAAIAALKSQLDAIRSTISMCNSFLGSFSDQCDMHHLDVQQSALSQIQTSLGATVTALSGCADGGAAVATCLPALAKATAELSAECQGPLMSQGDIATQVEKQITSDAGNLASDQAQLTSLECAMNSFAGTTSVMMADGTSKSIDQIKIGDKIANNLPGVDPGTTDQAHTVTAVHVTYTDRDYTDVTIDTGHGPAIITGTAHHPYWDATTHAWTDADQLHPGDTLQTSDGQSVIILALHDYSSTMVTYNLTVDGVHTYYVLAGSTPVLVHNTGCGDVELGPGIKSGDALSSFTSPKPESEFIFDPGTGKFLAGDRELIPGGPSPHEQLAQSMGADTNTVLGGTFFRDSGRLVFTENSGHYGHRWTDATRQQFKEFLNGYGIQYDYRPWG